MWLRGVAARWGQRRTIQATRICRSQKCWLCRRRFFDFTAAALPRIRHPPCGAALGTGLSVRGWRPVVGGRMCLTRAADLQISHVQQSPPPGYFVHDPEQSALRHHLGHAAPVHEGALVPGGNSVPGGEFIAGRDSLFSQSHESHPFRSVPLSQSARSRLHESFHSMISSVRPVLVEQGIRTKSTSGFPSSPPKRQPWPDRFHINDRL